MRSLCVLDLVKIGQRLNDLIMENTALKPDHIVALYRMAVKDVTGISPAALGEPFARGVGEKMWREGL